MRLHHLRITAFGPFAGTVEVDFDDLSDSGLFLLSGPTGAGKTSVLDAVCFALYGDVPGDRAQARALRCDRAGADVAPRVELEVTLGGRRLRLVRSPAWERPKRRGSGTTRQQASVTVAERVSPGSSGSAGDDGARSEGGRAEGGGAERGAAQDGAAGAGGDALSWRPLTSRLDEAGHLVGELLGMSLTQFTQVAMLPQGRFQAFLRARSDERQALLARLFRTSRFDDVERWLRECRTELRRTSEAHHREVADLVSRVSEAADEPVPSAWAGATPEAVGGAAAPVRTGPLDLVGPADDGSLAGWARDLAEAASAGAGEAAAAATSAAAEAERARAASEHARSVHQRWERAAAASAEAATLDAAGAEHAARVEALEAARRAVPVPALHRQSLAATRDAAAADDACAGAVAEVAAGLEVLTVDRLEIEARRRRAEEGAGLAREALPRCDRVLDLARRADATAERVRATTTELAAVTSSLADQPAVLDRLAAQLAEARSAATALPAHLARVSALRERLEARAALVVAEAEQADARSAWLDARESAAGAHETLLAVRQARVDGMAAELATALAVGACCPVCGSDDHPRKAAAADGAPDARAEREAQRRLDDAHAAEHARRERHRDLGTRVALLRQRAGLAAPTAQAGGSPGSGADDECGADSACGGETDAALQQALGEAEALGEALAARAARVPGAERSLADARQAEGALAARVAALEAELAALDESASVLRTDCDEELAALRGVVAGVGDAAAAAGAADTAAALRALASGWTSEWAWSDSSAGADRARRVLVTARDDLAARAALCRQAEVALDRADAAEGTARAAAESLAAAVADAGFGSGPAAVAAALAAAREPADLDRLDRAVSHHRERLAAVRAVLDSPDLAEVRGAEPGELPDVEAAERQRRRTHDLLGEARERAAAAGTRAARLQALVAELEVALARWAPARHQHETVAGLASFCEGRSPDNRLQMRLSAYVLAHRLAQVVAAANERLDRMTGRRYALEHTGRRGAGETRGGLSLLVRDAWSGEARDPATLSGGETFVVALALALGLADVIAHEAGGAPLDTLFVDEGFGSLDADTLDEVLDVLDALREGGRVVGVVSHVAEVRDRVPTRLEVVKDRDGSTLRTARG